MGHFVILAVRGEHRCPCGPVRQGCSSTPSADPPPAADPMRLIRTQKHKICEHVGRSDDLRALATSSRAFCGLRQPAHQDVLTLTWLAWPRRLAWLAPTSRAPTSSSSAMLPRFALPSSGSLRCPRRSDDLRALATSPRAFCGLRQPAHQGLRIIN